MVDFHFNDVEALLAGTLIRHVSDESSLNGLLLTVNDHLHSVIGEPWMGTNGISQDIIKSTDLVGDLCGTLGLGLGTATGDDLNVVIGDSGEHDDSLERWWGGAPLCLC